MGVWVGIAAELPNAGARPTSAMARNDAFEAASTVNAAAWKSMIGWPPSLNRIQARAATAAAAAVATVLTTMSRSCETTTSSSDGTRTSRTLPIDSATTTMARTTSRVLGPAVADPAAGPWPAARVPGGVGSALAGADPAVFADSTAPTDSPADALAPGRTRAPMGPSYAPGSGARAGGRWLFSALGRRRRPVGGGVAGRAAG